MGTKYEQIAADWLRQKGYAILEMNYRCKQGEVDIIAEDCEYLVFVEVKFRRDGRAGTPEAAVDLRKQMRICRVADCYLLQHQLGFDTPVRFDVIAIQGTEIVSYKNAFPYISR